MPNDMTLRDKIHELYETSEANKEYTTLTEVAGINTPILQVFIYSGAAIDVEGDMVPFTVVSTYQKKYNRLVVTLYNHADETVISEQP